MTRAYMYLSLVALLSAASASAGEWPRLANPEPIGGGENDAAVIVGIGSYAYAPPIPGAEQNAEDWYRYLVYGRKVPVSNTVLLRGREGTLERLKKYAAEAAARVKPGGTLWFVFIGHGAPSQDGGDGVLVGHDAQQDADSLFARSLAQKELQALLDAGAQERTVVVLDACFSGKTNSGAELVKGLQPLLPVPKSTLAPEENRIVLTAAKSDQFAGPLPGADRPAFSYLALGGLRGWADSDQDGWITSRELIDYTTDTLRLVVKDRAQTPDFEGLEGARLAAAGKEPAPDLAQISLARREPKKEPVAPPLGVVAEPPMDPNRVKVDLIAADPDFRWDVYVDDEVICSTPCTRPLDPLRPILFRARESGFGIPPDKIHVASLGAVRGDAQVRAHRTSWGKMATGITFASLGGTAVMAGGMLSLLGCGDTDRAGMCTGGLIAAGSGLAVVGGGLYLILTAGSYAEIIPRDAPIEVGPSSVALKF